MVSNGFWHIVSVVKELRPPCPAEWLPNNFATIARTVRNVNTWEQRNSGFPQGSLPRTSKLLRRREIHAIERVERIVPRGLLGSGRLQKSHREFGNPRYPLGSGHPLAVVRPLFAIFVVVFIVDRQSMTRSEVNESRCRSSSRRDGWRQRRNQIRNCSVIFGRQRNTKTLPCPAAAWTAYLLVHSI